MSQKLNYPSLRSTLMCQIKVHKMAAMFCHFEYQPNTRCPATGGKYIRRIILTWRKSTLTPISYFGTREVTLLFTLVRSSARVTWGKEEKI